MSLPCKAKNSEETVLYTLNNRNYDLVLTNKHLYINRSVISHIEIFTLDGRVVYNIERQSFKYDYASTLGRVIIYQYIMDFVPYCEADCKFLMFISKHILGEEV